MIIKRNARETVRLGQFFELMFLSTWTIERDSLAEKLVELGLKTEERSGTQDWMSWDSRKLKHVGISATAYHGIWNAHFVRLGFDSNLFRNLGSDERKDLTEDFLALGLQIWNAFQFYEGELSPEDEGSLLYGLRDKEMIQLRDILPANN